MSLSLNLSLVNIYNIGDELKSVKRNTYRQDDIRYFQIERTYKINGLQKKSRVLKKSKYSEKTSNCSIQNKFCMMPISGKSQTGQPCYKRHRRNQNKVLRTIPRVKS